MSPDRPFPPPNPPARSSDGPHPAPVVDQAPLRILYLDDAVVAVDKPPGLLVHRSRLAEAEDFLLQRLRRQLGRRVYTVHRLDRPTSGVILFALTPDAARRLSACFQAHSALKRYLAVVRGWPALAGRIDYAIADDEAEAAGQRAHRTALTDYRRLATVELPVAISRYPTSRYALMEITPRTGRRHQIRRHFAHIRHPLIGDTTHGEGRHNRHFRLQYGMQRLLLHALTLEVEHPNGGTLQVVAPLDDAWRRLLRELGWSRFASGEACSLLRESADR
jgi:tRNA pseudouridine65 synthase